LVARAARACRRCARVALQYSPTAHICVGAPKRPICEGADFCALVKESVQAEHRDKMLALRYFGMTEAPPRTPNAYKASDAEICLHISISEPNALRKAQRRQIYHDYPRAERCDRLLADCHYRGEKRGACALRFRRYRGEVLHPPGVAYKPNAAKTNSFVFIAEA